MYAITPTQTRICFGCFFSAAFSYFDILSGYELYLNKDSLKKSDDMLSSSTWTEKNKNSSPTL